MKFLKGLIFGSMLGMLVGLAISDQQRHRLLENVAQATKRQTAPIADAVATQTTAVADAARENVVDAINETGEKAEEAVAGDAG